MKLHAYGVAKGLLTRQGEDLQASFGPATIADDVAGISAISDINSARANAQAVKTVEAVKGYLKPYWKCFDD
jgi:hypothetical protein